jgi:hypothetical protein
MEQEPVEFFTQSMLVHTGFSKICVVDFATVLEDMETATPGLDRVSFFFFLKWVLIEYRVVGADGISEF